MVVGVDDHPERAGAELGEGVHPTARRRAVTAPTTSTSSCRAPPPTRRRARRRAARCRSGPPTGPRPRATRRPSPPEGAGQTDEVGWIDARRPEVVERHAVPQPGRRRGEDVAPVEGRGTPRPTPAGARRQRHGAGPHRPRRRRPTAAGRCRGPRNSAAPPAVCAGEATDTATARRAVPTPGSTTAITTPSPRYGTARTNASAPALTSNGGTPWVRSMMGTPGAWRARTARTTPANSSAYP